VAATAVGAGILVSRLAGLLRVRLISHYFGQQSPAVDAFNAAFRIPNLLQNLFGEGALSGSFIPVHSALRARGEHEAAAQTARTFFAILSATIAVLVLLGVLAAPWMTELLVPGFEGAKRELTIRLVRILFPGAGLLVASAWCLGVLNSHGKFLLSYTAPVAWNAAMIATLVMFGGRHDLETLAIYLAWGSVAGSFLQVAVQWPFAWRLSHHRRGFVINEWVRQIGRNFVPVTISRGAVQLNAYVDQFIASWLPDGAVTGLANAQLLYTLPVSLFGVSISAAELPALSGDATRDPQAGYTAFRTRLDTSLRRLAFFIIPSAVALAALGDVIAGTVLQTGRFRPEDANYVWGILAGSSIGLLASTMSRLYSVAHYALSDAKRPLRYALARLVVAAALGSFAALVLPGAIGLDPRWGAAALTAASAVAGWIEFVLLRSSVNGRIGKTGLEFSYALRLWIAAIVAAAIAWGAKLALPPLHPIVRGAMVLPAYGVAFLAFAMLLRVPVPMRIPGLRR
jgi:putative peptidoglycan lipid II flippase